MLRRAVTVLVSLTLVSTGACSDDGGDDLAAVTSIPDDTTTSSTTTSEPRTVAPDVIPTDESLITEAYVEGVLGELAQASLEAFLATREAGVADERAIAIVRATTVDAYAAEVINNLAQAARDGFDHVREDPGPVRFDVVELLQASKDCIVTVVRIDTTDFSTEPAADPPPGRTVVQLRPARPEQLASDLNGTAWVVESIPHVGDGDPDPGCGTEP